MRDINNMSHNAIIDKSSPHVNHTLVFNATCCIGCLSHMCLCTQSLRDILALFDGAKLNDLGAKGCTLDLKGPQCQINSFSNC